MEVKRKELQEALQKCLPGVETGKAVLEGADTFVFKGGKVYSYNDNISVCVPCALELEGSVKAKEFYTLISKMTGEDVKITEIEGNAWKFKSGSASAELTLLETSVMKNIKGLSVESAKWKTLPEKFIDCLALCRFTSNHSPLSGVFVSGKSMVATDELRINWCELDKEMDSFWIADSAVGEVIRMDGLKQYCLTDSWIHFKAAGGVIFSCKRLQHAKYPYAKIQSIVEAYNKSKSDLGHELPLKLVDAVDRAATFSMEMEAHPTVRLTFKPEYIEVYSQRSTGKYQERVAWDTPIAREFEPVVLYVDFSMISYGLKRSKSFYIKEKRIVFQGENIRHILSTFQMKEKKGKKQKDEDE
jgi:hypothetical protein